MKKKFMEVGKAVGTHGIRGEVKIEPWCDDAAFLCKFKTLYLDKDGKTPVKAIKLRPHKTNVLAQLEGVDTPEAANALRGKVFYIAREDAHLPKEKWFIQDLIGCEVADVDTGKIYGKITDVYSNPKANDVWSVTDANGKETMIPAIPSVIIETDVENELVKIRPLKGLFDGMESVIEDAD